MDDGDWSDLLTRGDIMAWAIFPVPRKEILEKMSDWAGVVEKAAAAARSDRFGS